MYNRTQYINSESPIKKDLLRLFNKEEKLTIFDIGGCEGEDSIRYSKIFPLASIFVFEPLPNNQALINRNLVQYEVKTVELCPIALSDSEGVQDFFVSSGHPDSQPINDNWNFGNKSSSLLPPNDKMELISWLKFETVIKVNTDTLNNFSKNHNIDIIDFVHMDVQGAELKVLKGAGSYLRKIKVIWLEVSDISLYKYQPLRTDIEQFMNNSGFKLIKTELKDNFGDQMYINQSYFREVSFVLFKKIFRVK